MSYPENSRIYGIWLPSATEWEKTPCTLSLLFAASLGTPNTASGVPDQPFRDAVWHEFASSSGSSGQRFWPSVDPVFTQEYGAGVDHAHSSTSIVWSKQALFVYTYHSLHVYKNIEK